MKHFLTLGFWAISLAASAGPMGYGAKEPVLPPPAPPPPQCHISYDFIEAGWSHIMPDVGHTSEGAYVGFNHSLNSRLFALGHLEHTFTGDEETDAALGLGYHLPLFDCFDWTTKLAGLYINSDYGDDCGYTAGTGFRVSVARWLELGAFYHVSQILTDDDGDLSHSASASLVFKELVVSNLDTVVSGIFSDSSNGVSVGLRYNF